MSLIRDNLMTLEGYSPYCGRDDKCFAMWPRTEFDGKQFRCKCGWRSQFDDEFIKQYKEKWCIK